MLKIEKGLPIPPKFKRTSVTDGYPFDGMEIGDSFLVESPVKNQKKTAARVAFAMQRSARATGRKFTLRKVDNGVRCWRIA